MLMFLVASVWKPVAKSVGDREVEAHHILAPDSSVLKLLPNATSYFSLPTRADSDNLEIKSFIVAGGQIEGGPDILTEDQVRSGTPSHIECSLTIIQPDSGRLLSVMSQVHPRGPAGSRADMRW